MSSRTLQCLEDAPLNALVAYYNSILDNPTQYDTIITIHIDALNWFTCNCCATEEKAHERARWAIAQLHHICGSFVSAKTSQPEKYDTTNIDFSAVQEFYALSPEQCTAIRIRSWLNSPEEKTLDTLRRAVISEVFWLSVLFGCLPEPQRSLVIFRVITQFLSEFPSVWAGYQGAALPDNFSSLQLAGH